MNDRTGLLTVESIRNCVYTVRGKQVMLDSDLADIYGYEVKRLNEQVKRNINRFPEDFMFQLTKEEFENLKSQFVTSSWGGSRRGSNPFYGEWAWQERISYDICG